MFNKNKVLVVIPARSGSKGVKNKNIKKINGIPLLAHSINYAKKSIYVDKIVVSSDSKKYLNISKKFGAETPFIRNKTISNDYTKDHPVIKDALLKSEKIYRTKFNYVILLRPTSPFREKNLIERSLKLLKKYKSASSVRSVIKTKNHPYRSWILKKNFIYGFVNKINESYNIPRQKLPTVYFQTGDIETIKRSTLLKGSISGNNVLPVFVKKYLDLDHAIDFKNINK